MDLIYSQTLKDKPVTRALYTQAYLAYTQQQLDPQYYNALLTILDLSGVKLQRVVPTKVGTFAANDSATSFASFLFIQLKAQHLRDSTAMREGFFRQLVILWGKYYRLSKVISNYLLQFELAKAKFCANNYYKLPLANTGYSRKQVKLIGVQAQEANLQVSDSDFVAEFLPFTDVRRVVSAYLWQKINQWYKQTYLLQDCQVSQRSLLLEQLITLISSPLEEPYEELSCSTEEKAFLRALTIKVAERALNTIRSVEELKEVFNLESLSQVEGNRSAYERQLQQLDFFAHYQDEDGIALFTHASLEFEEELAKLIPTESQDTSVEFFFKSYNLHLALSQAACKHSLTLETESLYQTLLTPELAQIRLQNMVYRPQESLTQLWDNLQAWDDFLTHDSFFIRNIPTTQRLQRTRTSKAIVNLYRNLDTLAQNKLLPPDRDNVVQVPAGNQASNFSLFIRQGMSLEENSFLTPSEQTSTVGDSTLIGTVPTTDTDTILALSLPYEQETNVLRWLIGKYQQGLEEVTAATPFYTKHVSSWLESLIALLETLTGGRKGITNQEFASLFAVGQSLSILIGGPGTGKTTTAFRMLFLELCLKALIKYDFSNPNLDLNQFANLQLLLVAPTGKAAAHLGDSIQAKALAVQKEFARLVTQSERERYASEQDVQVKTKEQALHLLSLVGLSKDAVINLVQLVLRSLAAVQGITIHSALGSKFDKAEGNYQGLTKYNADIVVCDEVGMVNLPMFNFFIHSFNLDTKVILLGDKNQLPSIGEGDVLATISAQVTNFEQAVGKEYKDYPYFSESEKLRIYSQHIAWQDTFTASYAPIVKAITGKGYSFSYWQQPTVADMIHELRRSFRYAANSAIALYAEYINANPTSQNLSDQQMVVKSELLEGVANLTATLKDNQVNTEDIGKETTDNTAISNIANNFVESEISKSLKLSPSKDVKSLSLHHLSFIGQLQQGEDKNAQFFSYQAVYQQWLQQLLTWCWQDQGRNLVTLREQKDYAINSFVMKRAEEVLSKHRELQIIFEQAIDYPLVVSNVDNDGAKVLYRWATWHSYVQKMRGELAVIRNKEICWLAGYGHFVQSLVLTRAAQAFADLAKVGEEYRNSWDNLESEGITKKETTSILLDLIEEKLPKAFDILKENRFLCPIRKGTMGVNELNMMMLQRGYFNSSNFRPIVITKNQKELDISNGDLALIVDTPQGTMAYFNRKDEKSHKYVSVPLTYINKYEYAFFTTIHKSQGDEFNHTYIVMPLEMTSFAASKSMLYTAITRAKKKLSIFAPDEFYLQDDFMDAERTTTLNYSWDIYL